MKNFIHLIFISFSFTLSAQTTCENFEGKTITTTDKDHAFNLYGNGNPGFLSNWNVTSGTPSIYYSGALPGVNAYSGNQYALTGVCGSPSDISEGVSLTFNFAQGVDYKISMAVRNEGLSGAPTPIDVEFVLLPNKINYTYNTGLGCSATPSIPVAGQVVYKMDSFKQSSWNIISFNTGNLTTASGHLWMRLKRTAGAPANTTFFLFDSICIAPVLVSKCYSFDDQIVTLANRDHAFNTYGNGNAGFLSDWKVVSGTPSLYSSGSLSSAYSGNQFALQGVCDNAANSSEGVSLQYPFTAGKKYQVSMAVRNVSGTANLNPINVDYVLLSNPISYTYNTSTGCSPTPSIPGGALTVYTIDSLREPNWKVISFTTNTLSTNYSSLWFRGKFHSSASLTTAYFLFDSVCVTELSPNSLNDLKNQENRIAIFPNPASEMLTIVSPEIPSSINVLDVLGKNVLSSKDTQKIDISSLQKGIYFIQVTVENKVSTLRFSKE